MLKSPSGCHSSRNFPPLGRDKQRSSPSRVTGAPSGWRRVSRPWQPNLSSEFEPDCSFSCLLHSLRRSPGFHLLWLQIPPNPLKAMSPLMSSNSHTQAPSYKCAHMKHTQLMCLPSRMHGNNTHCVISEPVENLRNFRDNEALNQAALLT